MTNPWVSRDYPDRSLSTLLPLRFLESRFSQTCRSRSAAQLAALHTRVVPGKVGHKTSRLTGSLLNTSG